MLDNRFPVSGSVSVPVAPDNGRGPPWPTCPRSLLVHRGQPPRDRGLLPTYSAIGAAAPALLVLCRLVQGLGLGGEWGGAVLMAVEHAPARRRIVHGSLPQMGNPAGLVLATVVMLLCTTLLPVRQFQSWGWRIPFLLSVTLIVAGGDHS